MGVGHSNKKLDKRAQRAIDDMCRQGSVSRYTERKESKWSINKLLLISWFVFLAWLFISKAF